MELKNQVCTLEQAKKLFELQVRFLSYFSHVHRGNGWEILPDGYFDLFAEGLEMYSAFSVSELGVMLSLAPEDWAAGQELEPATTAQIYSAEWVAKCVIYLLENKLITPEQVNASLTQQQ